MFPLVSASAFDVYLSRTGSAIVCVLVHSKVYLFQDGLQALNIGMSFMRRLKGGNMLARCCVGGLEGCAVLFSSEGGR